MKVNLQGQVRPTLQGSRWACGPQVVKAGAKELSTLTCGVGMNARGGGVSVCWVWKRRLSVSHPPIPLFKLVCVFSF